MKKGKTLSKTTQRRAVVAALSFALGAAGTLPALAANDGTADVAPLSYIDSVGDTLYDLPFVSYLPGQEIMADADAIVDDASQMVDEAAGGGLPIVGGLPLVGGLLGGGGGGLPIVGGLPVVGGLLGGGGGGLPVVGGLPIVGGVVNSLPVVGAGHASIVPTAGGVGDMVGGLPVAGPVVGGLVSNLPIVGGGGAGLLGGLLGGAGGLLGGSFL